MTTNSEERPRGATLQPHPPELKERGYRLYEQGKSNPEIAAELEIPLSTINRWSSKEKWKLRRQLAGHAGTELGAGLVPSSRLAEEAKQKEAEQRARDRKKTLPEAQRDYEETMQAQALRIASVIEQMPGAILITAADRVEKLDKIARKALKLESDKPRMLVNIALLAHGTIKRAKVVGDLSAPALLINGEDAGCKPVSQSAGDAAGIDVQPCPGTSLPAPSNPPSQAGL